MTKETFWQMIAEETAKAGSSTKIAEPLVERLSQLEPPEIVQWQQIFREYRELADKNLLWAAGEIINEWCSDDGFMDFRAWLIAQGKDTYLNALRDPNTLANADIGEGWAIRAKYEAFNYIGVDAFEIKNPDWDIYDMMRDNPLPDETVDGIRSEIIYAENSDVRFSFEEREQLRELMPTLYDEMETRIAIEIEQELGEPNRDESEEYEIGME